MQEVSLVIEVYVCAAAALLIAGVVIGGIAVVSLGIHREDRNLSLRSDITDRVARGARRVTGAGTRSLELASEASRRQDVLPAAPIRLRARPGEGIRSGP